MPAPPNKTQSLNSFVSVNYDLFIAIRLFLYQNGDLSNFGQLLFEWFNLVNEAGSMYSKYITMNPPEYDITFKFVNLPKNLLKEIISSQEVILTNK